MHSYKKIIQPKRIYACDLCHSPLVKDKRDYKCQRHGKRYVFDSFGEYNRWLYLSNLQDRQKISNLTRQIDLVLNLLDSNGDPVPFESYRIDFIYFDNDKNIMIYEDYKPALFDSEKRQLKPKIETESRIKLNYMAAYLNSDAILNISYYHNKVFYDEQFKAKKFKT